MLKRLSITVRGRVQGVFFRTSTRAKARELSLTGWVRNDPTGTVSMVAEGREEDLKAFLEWCYTGPRWSRVDGIDFAWQEATREFSEFKIT